MDNNFEDSVPWVSTNKLTLPDRHFAFPLKDRYNAVRAGRIPGYMVSDDPPKLEDEGAKRVEELIDKSPMEIQKKSATDELVDLPKKDAFEEGIYDPEVGEEGKGGSPSSSSSKPEGVVKDPYDSIPPEERMEVIDPTTGEVTSIPEEGSSFYSAGGYKTRKYKVTFHRFYGRPLPRQRAKRRLGGASLKKQPRSIKSPKMIPLPRGIGLTKKMVRQLRPSNPT